MKREFTSKGTQYEADLKREGKSKVVIFL